MVRAEKLVPGTGIRSLHLRDMQPVRTVPHTICSPICTYAAVRRPYAVKPILIVRCLLLCWTVMHYPHLAIICYRPLGRRPRPLIAPRHHSRCPPAAPASEQPPAPGLRASRATDQHQLPLMLEGPGLHWEQHPCRRRYAEQTRATARAQTWPFPPSLSLL